MIKQIIFSGVALLTFTLFSCGGGAETKKLSEKDSLRSEIDTMEMKIEKVKASNQLDTKLAGLALDAYSRFAAKYKDDSLTPWYLYKAADLASSALGQHARGVDLYEQIIANYKSFPKYPECLFLAGFLSQDKLQDGTRAKKHYDELLAKYPNHDFADDAKAMMSFFGKSDEEIIKEFEKKNSEKMNQ